MIALAELDAGERRERLAAAHGARVAGLNGAEAGLCAFLERESGAQGMARVAAAEPEAAKIRLSRNAG